MGKMVIKITTVHGVFALSGCVEAGGLFLPPPLFSLARLLTRQPPCHGTQLSTPLRCLPHGLVIPSPRYHCNHLSLYVPTHANTYHRTDTPFVVLRSSSFLVVSPVEMFISTASPHSPPPFTYVAVPFVHLSISTVPRLGLVSLPVSFSPPANFFSPSLPEMINCESILLV